jgi:hypothetical protein
MNFKLNFFINNLNIMSGERKNIDSLIESKVKNSLSSNVSEDFNLNLMKRIEIEQQFREEDKKTFNLAKVFSGIIAVLLLGISTIIGFIIITSETAGNTSSGIADKISYFYYSVSQKIVELSGLQIDSQLGLMLLVIMAVIFLFSIAEKVLIRKG